MYGLAYLCVFFLVKNIYNLPRTEKYGFNEVAKLLHHCPYLSLLPPLSTSSPATPSAHLLFCSLCFPIIKAHSPFCATSALLVRLTRSHYNWKWNLAQRFLEFEFYSFHVLGSARTRTAITRQRVAYLPKAALQIVCSSRATYNMLILVEKKILMQLGQFSQSGSDTVCARVQDWPLSLHCNVEFLSHFSCLFVFQGQGISLNTCKSLHLRGLQDLAKRNWGRIKSRWALFEVADLDAARCTG